jgi:hypothetical protein
MTTTSPFVINCGSWSICDQNRQLINEQRRADELP